ncbi:MAG: flavodoxin family protein [Actinomycetes bacterium]
MHALVVYESMFGSTREIAERIAVGLRTGVDKVEVCRVGDADVVRVADADLVVVGGPTHAHGMSRPQTRQAAVSDPAKYGKGAPLEPGADGIGLREWFEGLPAMTGAAAAFDTRADVPAVLSGRAAKGIAQRLRRSGFRLVDGPQGFLIGKESGLKTGEADRAEAWGRALARARLGRASGETRRQGAE